jgi:hypothetical protein
MVCTAAGERAQGPDVVTAGLVPAIHAFCLFVFQDVDARHKAGHDE